MRVLQTNEFAKAVRKLPAGQKADVDHAIQAIMLNPSIGEMKVGDLAGIQVYKFRINRQQALLAYEHDAPTLTLYLLKLGTYENFYRDLKRGEFPGKSGKPEALNEP